MSYHHHIYNVYNISEPSRGIVKSYLVTWYHTCYQNNIIISLISLSHIMVPSILLTHIHRRFKSIFIIAIKPYLFGRLLDNSKQKIGICKMIKIIKMSYQQVTRKPYPFTDLGVSNSPYDDLSWVGPQSQHLNLYRYDTHDSITTLQDLICYDMLTMPYVYRRRLLSMTFYANYELYVHYDLIINQFMKYHV